MIGMTIDDNKRHVSLQWNHLDGEIVAELDCTIGQQLYNDPIVIVDLPLFPPVHYVVTL